MKKNRKPRPMRRLLSFADVSGLRWLRSLSVKGCTGLRELLLPPGLTALDASTSNLEAAASMLREAYSTAVAAGERTRDLDR